MSAVTFLLPTHVGKSKRMRPYEPLYTNHAIREGMPNAAQFARGILDHRTGKFHARSYSDIELGSLARWLNDRVQGYPSDES